MVFLVASLTIGLSIGRMLQTNTLILASTALWVIWIAAAFIRGSFSIVDVLLLFSYLSALQGGFLFGAYLQGRYAPKSST
jgi:hypothetical protein